MFTCFHLISHNFTYSYIACPIFIMFTYCIYFHLRVTSFAMVLFYFSAMLICFYVRFFPQVLINFSYMFNHFHMYAAQICFTYVRDFFTHVRLVYQCSRFSTIFTYIIFTWFYLFLQFFTYSHLIWLFFSHVRLFSKIWGIILESFAKFLLLFIYPSTHLFTYFHPFSPIFTYFHLFSPIFIYAHLFSPIFTYFHLFHLISPIFTYFYLFSPIWLKKAIKNTSFGENEKHLFFTI